MRGRTGGKGSCAVCVDLQAVGVPESFGGLYKILDQLTQLRSGLDRVVASLAGLYSEGVS